MNGDFATITFDPARQFSRVLLQQGRMLLEADYNEQSAIHHHFLRTLITDLVGRCWRAGDGFSLGAPTQADDFRITKGHLYIDGILCEHRQDSTYATQPYGPVPDAAQAVPTDGFMVYVDCWERHVSAVQLPALREIALGVRDTATRAQIVWQVRIASPEWAKAQVPALNAALQLQIQNAADEATAKAAKDALGQVDNGSKAFLAAILKIGSAGTNESNCTAARNFVDVLDVARPRLRAMAKAPGAKLDPCAIAADSQYRGRENQLYRIQIHKPGPAGQATFVWSRENASIAFRIVDEGVVAAEDGVVTVELESLGHDRRTGLCKGDWVELSSDALEFGALAPSLGQVTKIDPGKRTVTLKVGPDVDTAQYTGCTLLRRWDQVAGVNASGTIAVVEGVGDTAWIPIERSIRIQFAPGGLYRTGDYWLIPARVASGDIIWPQTANGPAAIPPHGIVRHRAPIGFGKKVGANWTFTPCGCNQQPLCEA